MPLRFKYYPFSFLSFIYFFLESSFFLEIQDKLREYNADGVKLTLHIAVAAGELYTFHLVRFFSSFHLFFLFILSLYL